MTRKRKPQTELTARDVRLLKLYVSLCCEALRSSGYMRSEFMLHDADAFLRTATNSRRTHGCASLLRHFLIVADGPELEDNQLEKFVLSAVYELGERIKGPPAAFEALVKADEARRRQRKAKHRGAA